MFRFLCVSNASKVGLATTIDQYIQENKLFHALKVLEDLRVEIGSFRVRHLWHID